jgi:nitrogen fixation NifU-like protein
MTDLQELYQSVILDHNRKPRNFGALAGANRTAEGKNPLCGDQVQVELLVEGDVISDVHFTGHGCAISKASASLMTAAVKGKTRAEAEALFQRFHALVLGQDPGAGKELGKCASLAWHTLKAALAESSVTQDTAHPVSTE